MEENVQNIPVDLIDDPPVLLRPVNRLSLEYIELRDSIQARGYLNSISVRPTENRFQAIDGMYRLSCARDLRLATIPAIVKEGVSDEELMLCQVEANACRPETTAIDFATQLRRVMKDCPSISIGELSARIHKAPAWIKNQLALLRLPKDIQVQIDRGEIQLSNAYLLARLPGARAFVQQAKQLTTAEFKRIAAQEIKRFTEQIRQGKLDRTFSNDFEPSAFLRSFKEVQFEFETRCDGPRVLVQENCKTPVEGFYAALKWVLNFDVSGVDKQKKTFAKKIRNTNE